MKKIKNFLYFLWFIIKQPFVELFNVIKFFFVNANRPKFLFWLFLGLAIYSYFKEQRFSFVVLLAFALTIFSYVGYEWSRGEWKHEMRKKTGFYKKQDDSEKGRYK